MPQCLLCVRCGAVVCCLLLRAAPLEVWSLWRAAAALARCVSGPPAASGHTAWQLCACAGPGFRQHAAMTCSQAHHARTHTAAHMLAHGASLLTGARARTRVQTTASGPPGRGAGRRRSRSTRPSRPSILEVRLCQPRRGAGGERGWCAGEGGGGGGQAAAWARVCTRGRAVCGRTGGSGGRPPAVEGCARRGGWRCTRGCTVWCAVSVPGGRGTVQAQVGHAGRGMSGVCV